MAQRKNTQDRVRWSHGTEGETNESISQSLTPEVQLIGGIDASNKNAVAQFDASGNLKTTATISGDVNVDSNSVDTSGFVGKGNSGDFTTAYADATTLTCSSLPTGVSAIDADDVVAIVQVATDGSVTNTYTRDDITLTSTGSDPTTLTVAEGAFVTTDTFVVYTNIDRNLFIGTIDSAAPSVRTNIAHVAETTVPTAVADGDVVDLNVDEYGRQRAASYNYSLGSNDVNEVAPALLLTSEAIDLNAATATGAGTEVDATNYNKMTYHIIVSSIDTDVTVKIQSSLDGTNYADISTNTIIANGTTEVVIEGRKYKYLRANWTAETGGTAAVVTVRHIFGN